MMIIQDLLEEGLLGMDQLEIDRLLLGSFEGTILG